MAFSATFYLSVGDGATSDYVDLSDTTKYILDPNGFSAPPPKMGDPYRTVTVTLYIYDASSSDTLWSSNYRDIEEKLYQARRAAGPYGILSGVTLGVQLDTSTMTYFDVVDGQLTVGPNAYSAIYAIWLQKVVLTLTCYPAGRGTEQTLTPSGFLTNGVNAYYYIPAIDGDMDPLTRIQITDCSLDSTVINRLRIGHRSLPGLASTDFVPFIAITPASPGTAYADSTATGGTCARLGTATTDWQTIATVTQPSAAIKATGLFDLFARVRDGQSAFSAPTAIAGTAYEIKRVQSANASGALRNALSISWPAPTTAGNCLALAVSWQNSATITVPSAWGSPIVSTANTGIWLIQDATSRSGAESLSFSSAMDIVATLCEYQGVLAASAVDQTNTATGTSTTNIAVSTSAATTQDYEEVLAVFATPQYNYNTIAAPAGWDLVTNISVAGVPGLTGLFLDTTQTAKTTQACTPVTTTNATSFEAGIVTLKGATTEYGSLSRTMGFAVVPVAPDGSVGPASSTTSLTLSLSNMGVILSWTAPTTGGTPDHYLLYAYNGSTWSYTSTGSGNNSTTAQVTSTSGWTSAIGPPTTNSGLSNWRAGISLASGDVVRFGPEATTAIGNSTWEVVNLGVVPLPPTVAPDGANPLLWQVQVQGSNQGATPALDVDFVAVLPHDEPQWSAEYIDSAGTALDLATPRVWQFDARRDERQSAVLYGAPVALSAVGVTNNNDSTVTISAGTAMVNVVNTSDAILAPGQFWFGAYLIPSFASGTPPANAPVLFQWGSGANEVGVNYSGGDWTLYSVAASTNTSASQAGTFAASTGHTVMGYATSSLLGIAMDSTTFTTHAAGGTPSLSGGTVTIGNVAGGSYPITAAVGWLVLGTGVPSAADWSYLAGLGATDPNPLTLSAGAALTICWHATRTDYAMNAAEAGFVPVRGISRLGRGGNVLGIMADTANGASDVVNSRFTVSVIVTPRYWLLTGEA